MVRGTLSKHMENITKGISYNSDLPLGRKCYNVTKKIVFIVKTIEYKNCKCTLGI